MKNQVNLQCRAELLQQWQDDVKKNPQAFAILMSMFPEFLAMLVHDAVAAAWLDALVNNAHTDDFLEATRLEAAHQVVRWGAAPRRGKSAENWYWLVGYLAGKCLRAAIDGDKKKALHHTISSAAALMNWNRAIAADDSGCGIGEDEDIKPVEVARFESPAYPEPETGPGAAYPVVWWLLAIFSGVATAVVLRFAS